MIYSNILKPKFRNLIRGFVLVLLAIFSLSLYSCQTTYTERYNPDNLKTDEDVKILDVTTKNDSLIDLSDCDAKYSSRFNESEDVYSKRTDTIFIKKEPVREYKAKVYNISTIKLNDLFSVNVEKTKTNVPLTVLAISGAVVATGLILLAIIFSSWSWHSG